MHVCHHVFVYVICMCVLCCIACVCVFLHAYYVCMCVHSCMHLCMCVCVCVCVCVHAHVHVCVCGMCACTYVQFYITCVLDPSVLCSLSHFCTEPTKLTAAEPAHKPPKKRSKFKQERFLQHQQPKPVGTRLIHTGNLC